MQPLMDVTIHDQLLRFPMGLPMQLQFQLQLQPLNFQVQLLLHTLMQLYLCHFL